MTVSMRDDKGLVGRNGCKRQSKMNHGLWAGRKGGNLEEHVGLRIDHDGRVRWEEGQARAGRIRVEH